MASIELSAGIMASLPARIVFPTSGQITANTSFLIYNYPPLLPQNVSDNSGYTTVGYISIYKGVVPTDFTGLTLPSSRSADMLVQFPVSSNIFDLTTIVTTNPVIINTAFVLAAAAGTATWFRWYTVYAAGPAIVQQIIGTVGATGSGADLEIPTTSIVSGRAYRIQNLRIQFPSSWSY